MNWIYSLLHREKKKNKNFDPEQIQADLMALKAQARAVKVTEAEKVAEKILSKLTQGKYKPDTKYGSDLLVFIGEPSVSMDLVNEVLKPHGVQIQHGFYGSIGTGIIFIRDPGHTLGRGRLPE